MNTEPIRLDDDEQCKPIHPEPEAECWGCQGEAVETGLPVFLCEDCRDHLAGYDALSYDMQQAAKTLYHLLREAKGHMPAHLHGKLRAVFHEHMAGYLPRRLREQYHEEVTEAVHKEVA